MGLRESDAIYRRAHVDDGAEIEKLRAHFLQSQIDLGLLDVPADIDRYIRDSTAQILCSKRAAVYVAESDAGLIGYIYGLTKVVPGTLKSKVASIEEVYVRPEERGGNLGIRLLNVIKDDFLDGGAQRIQSRVLAANGIAQSFWSSVGFKENLKIYELDDRPEERPASVDGAA